MHLEFVLLPHYDFIRRMLCGMDFSRAIVCAPSDRKERSMKIVLMEPLGVSSEIIEKLADGLVSAGHTFASYDTFTTDTDELIRRAGDADILMIANHPLPGEVIRADKNLKFISVAFVGIDHIDTDACKEQGVAISNTGGYCDDAVAELAVGLALDCLRNITECNAAVRSGGGKGALAGNELAGRTVGIIGTGAIGMRTAEIFKAFRCRLIGFNRSDKPKAREMGIELMPLDEVMKQADIITRKGACGRHAGSGWSPPGRPDQSRHRRLREGSAAAGRTSASRGSEPRLYSARGLRHTRVDRSAGGDGI